MGNVVGYVRKDMNGMSVGDQEKVIKAYCDENGLDILRWYHGEDDGFSDVVFGDEVQAKPFESVIVARNEAVSYNVNEYFAYKGILKRKGIGLIPVEENYGAYKLYANIMDDLVCRMADLERENLSKRLLSGKGKKAARGGYSGGQPPMGYKAVNGHLVINEDEAEIVRFIFKRKHSGQTMMGTVDALNEKGYKTRGGKKFLISSVQSVWHNEKFYRGWYKYGKDGEWVQGQHEPILKD